MRNIAEKTSLIWRAIPSSTVEGSAANGSAICRGKKGGGGNEAAHPGK